MEMRSLAIVLRTWSTTLAWVSPGIRRKLTVASALPGSTLSLSPALKMVSAVVVRTMASVGPVFSNSRSNSGLNSQRFDSTTRLKPAISGAIVSNISATVPRICIGRR